MEHLSQKVAAWASGLRFEDLPEKTVAAAKMRLLDTLAVAWAGSDAEGIGPMRDILIAQGGRPDSNVLGFGDKLPAGSAVMLNSAMGAALDFDGLHEAAGVHTDIVVVPAVLALAERQNASGKEVLTAICAGEEILVRLGLSAGTGSGWFFSSVFGVFAATLAVGRLLDLRAEALNSAMGVALCQASGSQQNLVEDRLTKRFQTGFAAQASILAAEMAHAGIGGPMQSLEGKFGLNTLFTPINPTTILQDLGTVFHLEELTLKKYPSCFCNHAAIEGVLGLAVEHDLQPTDIYSIDVTVSPFIERLVGAPFDPLTANQATAQFNLAYSVACALVRRRFTTAEIEPVAFQDSTITALADRVRIHIDPKNQNRFAPVDVSIERASGAPLVTRVETLPGTPECPMDDPSFEAKIEECFAKGVRPMPPQEVGRLIQRVENLESVSDINDLTRSFAADRVPELV